NNDSLHSTPEICDRPFGSRTSGLIPHDRFLNAASVALTRAHAATEPRAIKLQSPGIKIVICSLSTSSVNWLGIALCMRPPEGNQTPSFLFAQKIGENFLMKLAS